MNIEQHQDDRDMILRTTASMSMREIAAMKFRVEDALAEMLTRSLAPFLETYLKDHLDWNRVHKAVEDAMIRKMVKDLDR